MGDLEFLQTKEDAGDLFSNHGSLVAASGTVVSITPASGKTFYPTSASITVAFTGVASTNYQVEFQNDGTKIDRVRLSQAASAATIKKQFYNIMRKLLGDGIKVYRIQLTSGSVNEEINGSIEGYVV